MHITFGLYWLLLLYLVKTFCRLLVGDGDGEGGVRNYPIANARRRFSLKYSRGRNSFCTRKTRLLAADSSIYGPMKRHHHILYLFPFFYHQLIRSDMSYFRNVFSINCVASFLNLILDKMSFFSLTLTLLSPVLQRNCYIKTKSRTILVTDLFLSAVYQF